MKRRRILAVLMVAVMMIVMIPGMAVQADSISKEAQACKELGILIGADSTGVTTQYLSTMPTRIQAFIIVLRLKGLYAEATEYEGFDNFKDAANAGWAKNYMAYAKNHPELGWGGYPDGTFAPTDKISGQAFYKVMLETLGYRQGTDFEYTETLDFAEEIGLVKKADTIANMKSFNVNDIAKGIYSTLNTSPADSDKKLIDVMVENNIIAPENAVAAGFELETESAKVTSFKAVSNTRLDLEFDAEIQLQKGDIEISELDGDSRLSVLQVESRGKAASITTTAAEPFNAYEITVNTLVPTDNMVIRGYKNKYVGMPKDSVRPTAKHEVLGNSQIMVTFSEEMDRSTAENLSNYDINPDVIVLSAELGESNKTVLVETTNMSSRGVYKLSVGGVEDVSGNRMADYTAYFDGTGSDSQVPAIVSVKSQDNTTVVVTFNKVLDDKSAEDIDNYSINKGVSIIEAELDDSRKQVILTTTVQESGDAYKLEVRDVEDTWGNAMFRKEYNFVGDNSKLTADVLGISSNEVLITFSKEVDKETAEDPDNYSINNDLDVEDVTLDKTGKKVTLITSDQEFREVYTVTISNVTDLWGNEISTYRGKFGGMSVNNKDLSYTAKSNGDSLVVTYSKRVDKETAEDVFNYYLDKSLGYAAKATLDESDGRTVTLLTARHTSGKTYSITIKDVEDVSGEKISTDEKICTKKFVGINSSGGSDGSGELVIETVVTVDVNTIDLIFSDELTDDELDDMEVEVDVPEEYDYDLPSNLSYHKFFVGGKNNVRVQFETKSSSNPELFEAGNIYEVEVTDVERLENKDDANVKLFAGTSNPNDSPEVLDVNALNSTAVEIIFSEPVKGITKSQFEIKDKIKIDDVSVDDNNEITDRVILYISSATKLDDDEYRLYIKAGVRDAAGLNPVDTGSGSDDYVEFDGTDEDNEPPYVDSDIEVLDSYTIKFKFNEEIGDVSSSSFSVKKSSSKSSSSNPRIADALLADDNMTVTIYLNSKYDGLDEDNEYELEISSSVKDIQGMSVDSGDRDIEFDGVDIELEELEIIAAYIDEDNQKITLLANRELDISNLSMNDFELSGAGYYESSSDKVRYDEKSITIELENELDGGEELLIEFTSTGRGRIKDYNQQNLSTEEVEIETK